MKRYDIINLLIESGVVRADKYLEIGTHDADCLENVKAKHKTGVDHQPGGQDSWDYSDVFHNERSDNFFKENKEKFDIIFIDGEHSKSQSSKDLKNALKCLNKNGVVILHDVNPPNQEKAGKEWCGEVFKTVIEYRSKFKNNYLITADTDFGVCVIFPDITPVKLDEVSDNQSYNYLDANRKTILNLMEVGAFRKHLKGLLSVVDEGEESSLTEKPEDIPNEKGSSEEPEEETSRVFFPEDFEELKELYKEVFGKRPHHAKKRETIEEELKKYYAGE